jgi:formylglycine-generating enzyme required for sulfatase activity
VYEWVLDWTGPYPTSASTNYAKIDGGSERGARGGSWYYSANLLAPSYRGYYAPTDLRNNNGIRCARSP